MRAGLVLVLLLASCGSIPAAPPSALVALAVPVSKDVATSFDRKAFYGTLDTDPVQLATTGSNFWVGTDSFASGIQIKFFATGEDLNAWVEIGRGQAAHDALKGGGQFPSGTRMFHATASQISILPDGRMFFSLPGGYEYIFDLEGTHLRGGVFSSRGWHVLIDMGEKVQS